MGDVNMNLKISVVIPVYNAEEFLEESIESVLGQSLKEIEIICVDDGSTDQSLVLLQKYQEKYPNFTVLQQKNQYAGAARNYGTTVAKGEYLYYFDCDDILYDTALEELYLIAKTHDADVVRGKCRAFNHVTGEEATVVRYKLEKVPVKSFEKPLTFTKDYKVILQCSVAPWAGIVRREFVQNFKIEFPVLKCVNDRAFFIETMARANMVVISDVFIQNHRVNNVNSLVGKRFDNFDCQFKLYNFIAEKLKFMDEKLYRIALERELEDLISWFFKSRTLSNAEEIRTSVIQFVVELDKSIWDNVSETSWYEKIQKVYNDYRDVKVSVIIPVYNGAKFLRESVECICNQTLHEIQIICVDDGSTDNSLKILQELQVEDMRVQVLSQENRGASVARNKGLELAHGEYLSILDADDIFEADMLEKAYNKACSQDADVVVFRADRYVQDSEKYEEMLWSVNTEQLPQKDCFAPNEISGNIFRSVIGWSWDKLFKRTFIENENIRFQEIQLHNDLLFVFGAFVVARRITVIDEILVHQRRYEESLSAQCIAWRCVYYALKELEVFLKSKEIYDQYEQDFKNYVLHLFYHMLGRLNADDYKEAYREMGRVWIEDLGIYEHDKSYYYNPNEYEKALKIRRDVLGIGGYKKHIYTVKGFFLCMQEHGISYTVERIKFKMSAIFKH